MPKILGLDIGTNSIGWALINKEKKEILGMGSRIIPQGDDLRNFEQGRPQTKNANRRITRGNRKLNKRYKQRRNKLIYVLQQLGMLPEQIKLSEPFTNPLKIDRVCILPITKSQNQYSALDLLELRAKALYEKVSLQDLGKIIYWFNQLRGYSGGGNEPEKEEENNAENGVEKKDNESYISLARILEVSEPEIIPYKGKHLKKVIAKIETEDGILEGESFLEILRPNDSLDLQIKIRKSKQGEIISFTLPNKTSWRKKMENLEKHLSELSKDNGKEVYLSEYFLSILKENRWAKIRNNVILRSRYQSEFDAIWKEQRKHHDTLGNPGSKKLSEILYFIFPGPSQEKYRQVGQEKGLFHVIRNQIIYYQRELKDQTNLISDCRFEANEKALAKSHPVFQEYKIWEQINKLTINTQTEKGLNKKGEMKYAYEDKPIPAKLKEWLFDELQQKKEIRFGTILDKLKKEYGLRDGIDFLNGVNPKAGLQGNETKILLKKALGNTLWQYLNLEHTSAQIALWDILYNYRGNEYDLKSERTSKILSLLKEYSPELPNIEQTAIQISKIKFSRSYASLSLKAIDKILPLVRAGKYYSHELSEDLKKRIIKILNEVVEDPFEKSVQDFLDKNQTEVLSSGGIMVSYATILVYDRHTAKEYHTDEQIKDYSEITRLKPGSLRNPLVEQMINETLIIIKDIWKHYREKPTIIRLELARELKNNADRRKKLYTITQENQRINEEVKGRLFELKEEITSANIEKYKLWLSQKNLCEEYIRQFNDPSKSEIEKMRLWQEQGHISPYTGQPIPLSELFKRERYDVDHIIPQSRYFDDSLSNKVICEKMVNKDKGNKTSMEYFETGSSISSVFSKTEFIAHVNRYFSGTKRKNLLATKVPEDPIARQIKETQYISLRIREELNKIVGSNNVKTTTGGVTDYLKNQWGLTDKFKQVLLERYQNAKPLIAEAEYKKYESEFEEKRKEHEKNNIPFNHTKIDKFTFLESFSKSFIQSKNQKLIIKRWNKRIDHRHHAIDALVIACTEPQHIKRLNDLNKELQTWIDKKRNEVLPNFEGTPSELLDEILALDTAKREVIFKQIEKFRAIEMPWPNFPEIAEKAIREIVVSQKPKDKLLIQRGKNECLQLRLRGQLHEETLYGKSQGIEAYRIPLTKLAGKSFATEKTINKITDDYLRKVILNHLKTDYGDKKGEAFSAEGIRNLNEKLAKKKNKKGIEAPHTPISSIKVFYRDPSKAKKKKDEAEPEEALQRLDRTKAFNKSLYVKTGVNYLFAIMKKDGKRLFDLITFFDAVNLLKDELNKVPDKKTFRKDQVFKTYFEEKNKATLLFTLKQGDPVYMPDDGEEVILDKYSPLYEEFWKDRKKRSKNILYVTKFSGKRIYFINHCIADTIIDIKEFGSQNAYEKIRDISIREKCIKLDLDRLGNIKPCVND